MRQPKFLRHLVEKFLLKGQEANANLYPGILPIWETQPLGVTRLPEVPCRLQSRTADNVPLALQAIDAFEEPVNFSFVRTETDNHTNRIIVSNMPAGTIFRWKIKVSIANGSLTGPIFVAATVRLADIFTIFWEANCTFNPDCTCAIEFDTGWVFHQNILDLGIIVGTINPAVQTVRFSNQLCVYPNRELC